MSYVCIADGPVRLAVISLSMRKEEQGMKNRLVSLALAMLLLLPLLLPAPAAASNFYLIPDSDTRYLTEAELWEWQYTALGFVLNEIFARHGFPFDPDGNYYAYFNAQSWYHEDANFTYSRVNSVEWYNERLVKQVRQQMRDMDTKNPGGKPLPSIEPTLYNIPDEFSEYVFAPGQKLNVYSGPGTGYVRGANGKALVSTNGTVYVCGWENGWLLLLYRINNGGARIGYADGARIKGDVYADYLTFAYQDAEITRNCAITDDPVSAYTPLATLRAGSRVTYLTTLHNDRDWAYVEADTSSGLVRGCVPLDAVDTGSMAGGS